MKVYQKLPIGHVDGPGPSGPTPDMDGYYISDHSTLIQARSELRKGGLWLRPA